MSSECVNIITKNLPDLSTKEAKEIVAALVKKVEHDKKVGQAAGTAENQATILSEASAEIIDDLVTASFIQKRNAAFNIFAENNAMAFANSFQNKGLGWNSFLVGVSGEFVIAVVGKFQFIYLVDLLWWSAIDARMIKIA